MEAEKKTPVHGTDSVHTDTKNRDPSFVMTGHHCHTCFELFYVDSGDCRFLIEDQINDLHAGDFILIPPMALHYTRYVFGPCRRTVVLFREEDMLDEVRQRFAGSSCDLDKPLIIHVPQASRTQVAACLKQMALEDRISDAHSELMRKMYLQVLLLLCGRVRHFLTDPPADIRSTDQQVLQAAQYISQHYMYPLTTEDIARAVSFSPNYFSRKFRHETGIGLHEYLVFIRLHHAAQELISTDDSITAIALRCGFSDSNYFKDCFKHKYGVTPRQYRKIRS